MYENVDMKSQISTPVSVPASPSISVVNSSLHERHSPILLTGVTTGNIRMPSPPLLEARFEDLSRSVFSGNLVCNCLITCHS